MLLQDPCWVSQVTMWHAQATSKEWQLKVWAAWVAGPCASLFVVQVASPWPWHYGVHLYLGMEKAERHLFPTKSHHFCYCTQVNIYNLRMMTATCTFWCLFNLSVCLSFSLHPCPFLPVGFATMLLESCSVHNYSIGHLCMGHQCLHSMLCRITFWSSSLALLIVSWYCDMPGNWCITLVLSVLFKMHVLRSINILSLLRDIIWWH